MMQCIHALMFCLLSLMMVSWNQPVNAVGWGLRETESDHTGSSYHSHFQQKVPPYQRNYYPDFRNNQRETHPWHDHHGHKGYDISRGENPHQRDQEKTYFPYRNHRQGEQENPDMLSRRMYDDGYATHGPQFLGDAEERMTGLKQMHQSSHLNNIKNPKEIKINVKFFKRRKREEDIVEESITTEIIKINTKENSTENFREMAKAFTIPDKGGGQIGKRLNGGYGGKGHGSRRGPNKTKLTSSNNTRTGDIIFPDNPIFTPKHTHCAGKSTFCEDTEDYPKDIIRNILQNDGQRFSGVFGQETILGTNVTLRGYQDETVLCLSSKKVVFPTKAKTKDDKWHFVVNQDDFRQGIVVETCNNPDLECQMSAGFPLGYQSVCKQKFIIRRLLSVTDNGTAAMNEFLFPSCCVCILQFIGPEIKPRPA